MTSDFDGTHSHNTNSISKKYCLIGVIEFNLWSLDNLFVNVLTCDSIQIYKAFEKGLAVEQSVYTFAIGGKIELLGRFGKILSDQHIRSMVSILDSITTESA